MAGLLAKFRIDYSELIVISDITREPQDETIIYFEELIKDLKVDECTETRKIYLIVTVVTTNVNI